MATWVKFRDPILTESINLVNLEAAIGFGHNTKYNQLVIYINGSTFNVDQKLSPDVYKKVLEYMKQLEQQAI